jgi:hypothetical protein
MEPGVEEDAPEAATASGEARVMADSLPPMSRGTATEKRAQKARPRPFAKQTIHPPRRERKKSETALDRARAHLGEPVGSA